MAATVKLLTQTVESRVTRTGFARIRGATRCYRYGFSAERATVSRWEGKAAPSEPKTRLTSDKRDCRK